MRQNRPMAPYIVHGLTRSYFTRKVTGYLDYTDRPWRLEPCPPSLHPAATEAGWTGGIPVVTAPDGELMWDSTAIIEYLDETCPSPPLLPPDPPGRARVRAIALSIACEIHPLNNLRVLDYLTGQLGLDEAQRMAWYRHWVEGGLAAVEALLAAHPATGRFCHGDTPGLADCVLVPQVFNARRFDCRLDHVPTVTRIAAACEALDAFARAAPAAQPDAE